MKNQTFADVERTQRLSHFLDRAFFSIWKNWCFRCSSTDSTTTTTKHQAWIHCSSWRWRLGSSFCFFTKTEYDYFENLLMPALLLIARNQIVYALSTNRLTTFSNPLEKLSLIGWVREQIVEFLICFSVFSLCLSFFSESFELHIAISDRNDLRVEENEQELKETT